MSLMVIISALLLTAATTLTHLCLAPSAMLQIREPISTVPISQWHPQSQDAFESLFFFSFLSFFLFLHICSSGGLLDFKNENYVVSLSVFFFFFFAFLGATPMAHGNSQARAQIRAAELRHSHSNHSNARFEPHL